ncbi:hypothetical protein NDU88_002846 [Pleurodeles waltl]|uniref:Uncharacterized protein n=1 Tax=Pleurodeles waltl TaxID=8319 RepID=A0AAV7UWU6_PLEWA|nr:hypothetical protein NDU88_002846 [Pleurodeles waltl]
MRSVDKTRIHLKMKVAIAALKRLLKKCKYGGGEQALVRRYHWCAADKMKAWLAVAFLAAVAACAAGSSQRRGTDSSGRRYNRIQHGQCTYTFILPEQDAGCREGATTERYNANALQRDAPHVEPELPSQKLQHLEHAMENYTQWLQKVSTQRALVNVPVPWVSCDHIDRVITLVPWVTHARCRS